jgi:hypothetical protein
MTTTLPPPKIGDKTLDGIYAGLSPETGKPMYTMPVDASLAGTFNGAGKVSYGNQDWHEPTSAELNVLFNNRAVIHGFFDANGVRLVGTAPESNKGEASLRVTTAADLADYTIAVLKGGGKVTGISDHPFQPYITEWYFPEKAEALAPLLGMNFAPFHHVGALFLIEGLNPDCHFFTALKNCKVPALYGSGSVVVIAPAGVRVETAGHNEVRSTDNPSKEVALYPDVAAIMERKGFKIEREHFVGSPQHWAQLQKDLRVPRIVNKFKHFLHLA